MSPERLRQITEASIEFTRAGWTVERFNQNHYEQLIDAAERLVRIKTETTLDAHSSRTEGEPPIPVHKVIDYAPPMMAELLAYIDDLREELSRERQAHQETRRSRP